MTPELIQILFAVAGAALGWFAKRHPQFPPEIAEAVSQLQQILDRRNRDRAQGLLQELAAGQKNPPPGEK